MPCAVCGDIIPSEIDRCPGCGAWCRRRDFRALGTAVFMLLGFNAFIALGSVISLLRLAAPLDAATRFSYDAVATTRILAPQADLFGVSALLAGITGLLYLGWSWRAYGHATGRRRHARRWVVAGWLVPIVNLWLPPRLLYDVWTGSGRFKQAERHVIALTVTAWWINLLVAVLLTRAFQLSGAEGLAEARFTVRLGIAAAAEQALAATLCMVSVFYVTRLQVGGRTAVR